MVEDFCGRAEVPDDMEGAEGPALPLADVKLLVNEMSSSRSKKVLHLIPLDILVRLVDVLDRQIQCAQGLSIDGNENVSIICNIQVSFYSWSIFFPIFSKENSLCSQQLLNDCCLQLILICRCIYFINLRSYSHITCISLF